MRIVKPEVFLISYPQVDLSSLRKYLRKVSPDAQSWADRVERQMEDGPEYDGEVLVEAAGRICYRSWIPEINPNVSKVREDSHDYLRNLLSSGHGSPLEHANYTFICHNVSRVLTHELVRHRAGVAYSQESMRFVRLTDIPMWFPEWAREDQELMDKCIQTVLDLEKHQVWMTEHFGLNDPKVSFQEKKHKTSFMRRFAPEGVATGIMCTMNIRSLRHIIYMRTSLGAEEEIRLVCDEMATIALERFPDLMQDYTPNECGEWIPEFLKV